MSTLMAPGISIYTTDKTVADLRLNILANSELGITDGLTTSKVSLSSETLNFVDTSSITFVTNTAETVSAFLTYSADAGNFAISGSGGGVYVPTPSINISDGTTPNSITHGGTLLIDSSSTIKFITDGNGHLTGNIATNSLNSTHITLDSITTASLADGSVTTTKIANNSVTAINLANESVSSAKLQNSSITSGKIADGGVTSTKIADSGVVTDKIADGAVTCLKLENNAVSVNKIMDGNVTSTKIADSNITTNKITDGNVTTIKLASSSVTTAKIADSNVTAVKIASSAVTTSKIADGNVTAVKIANNNVTSSKLAVSSVLTDKIANGAVTSAKLSTTGVSSGAYILPDITVDDRGRITTISALSLTSSSILVGNAFNVPTVVSLSGDATIDNNGILTISNGSITTSKISDSSVTEAKIVPASITSLSLASNSVNTLKIMNGAVTSEKLVDSGVVSGIYTAPSLTIDSKGRVTSASSSNTSCAFVTDARSEGTSVGNFIVSSGLDTISQINGGYIGTQYSLLLMMVSGGSSTITIRMYNLSGTPTPLSDIEIPCTVNTTNSLKIDDYTCLLKTNSDIELTLVYKTPVLSTPTPYNINLSFMYCM